MEEIKQTPEQAAFLKAGEFVDKYYATYSSVLTPYKNSIKEWNKDYNCIPTKRTEGLSNTFVPESYIAVETVVADLVSLLLGYDPPFMGAEVPEEYLEHKKQMERLLWQLMQDGDFKRKSVRYIRGLSIDGIKPAYVFFNEEKKVVKDKVRDESGKFTVKDVEKITKYFPDFESPDIIDAFFDPMTHELSSILLQWKVNWSKIKSLAKQGRIKEELLDTIKSGGVAGSTPDAEKQIKDAKFKDMGFEQTKGTVEDEYLLKCYFGPVPKWWIAPETKDTEAGDEMVTGEVLRVGTVTAGINGNDYFDNEIPVIMGKWIENDNQMFSHSAISPTHLTQITLNTTRDQEIDFKTFSLYFIWIKSRQSNIPNDDLKIKPNHIIEADGDIRAALAQWRPDPAAFQSGNIMESTLKTDIQRSSAATASRQGMAVGGRTTAEEIQTMQQRGSMRAYITAVSIAETWFKPLLKKYWDLVKQNVQNPVSVIGYKGAILSDEIYGDYKFTPKLLTDPMNIMSLRSSILMLMENLGRVPEVASAALLNLGRKSYEIAGFTDGDSIFPPKDPLMVNGDPDAENKVMSEGRLVPAQEYQNHLAHLEKHMAAERESKDLASKHAYGEHIKHHFAFTGVQEKIAGGLNLGAGVTGPQQVPGQVPPPAAAPVAPPQGGMNVPA